LRACYLAGLFAFGMQIDAQASPEPAPDRETSPLAALLQSDSPAPAGERLFAPQMIRDFYAERGLTPAWCVNEGLSTDATVLLQTLAASRAEGLNPTDYHLATLTALTSAAPIPPDQCAVIELLMSDAYLHLASDLGGHRFDPMKIDPEWYISAAPRGEPLQLLKDALATHNVAALIERLTPPHEEYRRLRAILPKFRALADRHWPQLPEGPKLEAGMRDARVPVLRERLQLTGDIATASETTARMQPIDATLFDTALADAVRTEQSRLGLTADGIVGRRTRAALNLDARERLRLIEVNMERWRWLPAFSAPRYLVVNVSGYELGAFEQGRRTLAMRIVVGQTERRTPVFTSEMTTLVLNPYWNVPRSITVKDVIPHLREDPEYLENMNIRILSGWQGDAAEVDPATIDLAAIDSNDFTFRLRQDPGPKNALGRMKFLMPNAHSIYLHDTPKRSLFQRAVRAYSSGCIRLEQPMALATFLMQGAEKWDEAAITAAIDSGRTITVQLPTPVPTYLLYITAWVDDQGVVQFRDDIYGRDAGMKNVMAHPGTVIAYKTVN
jgi:murein L,D-transpeptidase YcbB/YkuD